MELHQFSDNCVTFSAHRRRRPHHVAAGGGGARVAAGGAAPERRGDPRQRARRLPGPHHEHHHAGPRHPAQFQDHRGQDYYSQVFDICTYSVIYILIL